MLVTLMPADCNVRMAASRPAPGPRTNASTWRRPCSSPLRAAFSAARWAANAVDFREPTNPAVPALPHAMGFPCGSVRVMTVLLNVDCMYARPTGTFFRTRRLVRGFLGISLLLSPRRGVAPPGHGYPLRALRPGVGARPLAPDG